MFKNILCHFLNELQLFHIAGLFFMWNKTTYLHGDVIFLYDIGTQPDDISDPGSTLVCVTTYINTACCRGADNNNITNDTAGAVGEWHYPDGTQVSPSSEINFTTVGYTNQVRLAQTSSNSTPPLGVYTCQVPQSSNGVLYNASITLQMCKLADIANNNKV